MSRRIRVTRGMALAPLALAAMLLLTAAGGCTQGGTGGTPATGGAAGWAGAAFATPAEVSAQLASATGPKPMLIHVGFKVLYKAGAIPGTVYLGPGSREDGIAALREAVKDVPHERDIVIYCGCCPWEDCPNMRPAYTAMQQMGFTHVRALKIAKNFDTDWAGHGYPVEKPVD
jgi:thiosulfate/3-mercaptopyruvate sulfurtransferase